LRKENQGFIRKEIQAVRDPLTRVEFLNFRMIPKIFSKFYAAVTFLWVPFFWWQQKKGTFSH